MGKFNDILKYLADSYHPVGSIYITNSATNPSSTLGGTWTCIKKTFDTSQTWFSSNVFTFNGTNTTNTAAGVLRVSDMMYLRLYFAPKVTFNDNTIEIGTFNYANVGLTDFWTPQGLLAISDPNNAAAMMNWSGATLRTVDVITRTTATTIAASTNQFCYCTQIPFANPDWMSNDACDQFYWKRTA